MTDPIKLAIEIRDALKAERLGRERQEPVAQAWSEGYRAGIYDERTSEANIGIAGMNMKVEPARKNPYSTTSGAGSVSARCRYPDCKRPTESPCLQGLKLPEPKP